MRIMERSPDRATRVGTACGAEPRGGDAAHALSFPAVEPIAMRLGWASGFLGSTTVSTPSFRSVVIWLASTLSGSVKARANVPYYLSSV